MSREIKQLSDIDIDVEQRETTRHGSRAFPVAIYYDVLGRNALGYVNWHWHDELQLCLVDRSEVIFYVGSSRYDLREGSGIVINSRVLHMISSKDPEAAFICINYSPKLLSLYPGSVFESEYVDLYIKNSNIEAVPINSQKKDPDYNDFGNCELENAALENGRLGCGSTKENWQEDFIGSMRRIYELFESGSGHEYEILHLLQDEWLALIRNAKEFHEGENSASQISRRNTTTQEILSYIDEHYMDRITIDDIAQAVSFSGSECCRIFKRELGETIFAYIKKYRVERSTQLLKNTSMPVTDVAYASGFSGTSYYIKSFRDVIGMTPKQYRNCEK